MTACRRREFLAAAAGTAVCLRGFGRTAAAAADVAVPPPPIVPLGATGITLSRIGQGTGMRGGNRQSNHSRMGFEKLVALFRHAYDRGVTFFDMADIYGTHVYFREALRSIPRDKVTILTKLWWRYDGKPAEAPPDFQKRSTRMAIERFQHEIATDRLDIVLLHCLESGTWDKELQAYMEALSELKEKKRIRAVGVSCHNFEALKTAAACPWVDVILARINPRGVAMDAAADQVVPVLAQAKRNGKAIIGMKIYGEGRLVERKDECMQFAQGLDFLDCMTIGSEAIEHVDDNLRLLAKYPKSA
ncbi:MAG TPA: aldo/keto reductase [Planctomycetes bacterium]|nr:aldo/keto reductase [Planctomycetota bacterium]